MEGLTGRIMLWIMNLGLTEGTAMLLIRTGVVVTMLLLAVLIDKICRKTVVPLIRRITSRTRS